MENERYEGIDETTVYDNDNEEIIVELDKAQQEALEQIIAEYQKEQSIAENE